MNISSAFCNHKTLTSIITIRFKLNHQKYKLRQYILDINILAIIISPNYLASKNSLIKCPLFGYLPKRLGLLFNSLPKGFDSQFNYMLKKPLKSALVEVTIMVYLRYEKVTFKKKSLTCLNLLDIEIRCLAYQKQ